MNKSDFFGRKPYLEILEKRIKSIKEGYRQNIAIIGDKDTGKTSLILHFLNKFSDPMILPIYLELRPEYTRERFVHKFIGVLLYNFLENSNEVLSEDLDFLISKTNRFIPKTIETAKVILNSVKRKRSENIFTQLLTLCDILHSETGKLCVVILDEFQHISTLGIKQIYKQFSKILMIQKNTLYIIISSAKFKAKKILSSQLSLLFGNFELIEMLPFNLKTTEEFLISRVSHLPIQKSLLNFLTHFTGGSPLYLRIITDLISRIPGPITKKKLAEIIQDLLFVESGLLNQCFNNHLESLFANLKFAQEYQALLYLIADGQNRLKDITIKSHKPKTQTLSRLNLLLEHDVITKSGDFFIICDRVFGFWLRFVYREKLDSLTFNREEQKKNFRIKIEDKIDQFISTNRKSILERTMELLRLFENELIQIQTRKIRLVQFREIKPLNSLHGELNTGLLGRSNDALWIMIIKSGVLTEEDIIDFSTQCRKLRYIKPQRKIIISNQGISTTVRLKAMEEKVLTWNLDDLNLILDLYDRPRVVL